jgi:hypothetical protein
MVVKNPTFIMRPICMYYNGCKKPNIYYETYMQVLQWLQKTQHLLRYLYVSITMVVKNPTSIKKPICEYCNGYKKPNIYYETYMRVL